MYRDTRLAGDWQDLLARLDRDATVARWGRLEPALAGLVRLDQLPAELGCGSDPVSGRRGARGAGPAGGR